MLATLLILIVNFGRTPRKLIASLGTLLIACAQAERMRADRIDHVHAHFVGHPATAAWVIRRLTGIEYSVTAHAYELFQDREFLRRRVRDARFVITISRFNANFLFRYCRGVTPPISVVRAGVDLERFTFRERILPREGPVRALAVGSLIGHKGHRILLQAIADENPALKRIELTIVGDGEERPKLEAMVSDLGLTERVRLLGSLPEAAVAELLADADLYVLPSLIAASGRMEGIPVVLMEALACGVPTVATRLSGIPELVEDGVTGKLAEQGNPESLRAAILAVLADPESARERARAGRTRVEEEFDVARSAEVLTERFLSTEPTARARGRRHRPAFVAWSRSARSREMAAATGGDCHVVFFDRLADRALAPIRYALSAVSTVMFLLRVRPSVVVATNPPIFPAMIVYLLGRLTSTDLVLDSHPRGFGLKRSRSGRLMTPVHRYLVRRSRATLVAGPELAGIVAEWGGRPMIVHEAPPIWSINASPEPRHAHTVLWAAVFASDEPVVPVLDAARRLPEVNFLITGDVNRCPPELRAAAPDNVTFTGFWVDEGYSRLVSASSVMLVLTTESASVPRAAFEAVEALRPLVISDMPSLRALFGDAVFVDNDAVGIAAGIREAIERHDELSAAADAARERQRARWLLQLQELRALISTDA
jgi:glycosyltransferase involved in cell wall biosynthesis